MNPDLKAHLRQMWIGIGARWLMALAALGLSGVAWSQLGGTGAELGLKIMLGSCGVLLVTVLTLMTLFAGFITITEKRRGLL